LKRVALALLTIIPELCNVDAHDLAYETSYIDTAEEIVRNNRVKKKINLIFINTASTIRALAPRIVNNNNSSTEIKFLN
jgi:hypothetical protein